MPIYIVFLRLNVKSVLASRLNSRDTDLPFYYFYSYTTTKLRNSGLKEKFPSYKFWDSRSICHVKQIQQFHYRVTWGIFFSFQPEFLDLVVYQGIKVRKYYKV